MAKTLKCPLCRNPLKSAAASGFSFCDNEDCSLALKPIQNKAIVILNDRLAEV